MKRATIDNLPLPLPLPEDLVREIFLRLSVKILSRCKVVCKQWCAFIESPSFVNQHFSQESNQDRLLLCVGNFLPLPDQEVYNAIVVDDDLGFEDPESDESYDPDFYLEDYEYALSVDETFSEFEVPSHLQKMPDAFGEFIGPLNGVFCVVYNTWPGGPMALLNLATRQFKPLPLVDQVLPDGRSYGDGYLGIGLDPSSGDFKLVLIIYYHCKCFVCVCTSDSDSWRLIENVDSNVPSRRVHNDSICNTYLNGVYYWPLDFNDTSDVAILAFDMRTEKFKEIQVMSSVARYTPEMLALHGDSLVFLMHDNIDGCSDVWMMLDEGSWIKSFRVLCPVQSIGYPLCFWRNNNELLLAAGGPVNTYLKSYNISTQELRDLKVKRRDGRSLSRWVLVYKESLVSLKGKSGKCRVWDTSDDFVKDFFMTTINKLEPHRHDTDLVTVEDVKDLAYMKGDPLDMLAAVVVRSKQIHEAAPPPPPSAAHREDGGDGRGDAPQPVVDPDQTDQGRFLDGGGEAEG